MTSLAFSLSAAGGLSTILPTLGGLFAIVAVLGVAYVYFRGSADKATIESQGRLIIALQGENADLQHRVDILERENAELKVKVAEVRGITNLRREAAEIKADVASIKAEIAYIRERLS